MAESEGAGRNHRIVGIVRKLEGVGDIRFDEPLVNAPCSRALDHPGRDVNAVEFGETEGFQVIAGQSRPTPYVENGGGWVRRQNCQDKTKNGGDK